MSSGRVVTVAGASGDSIVRVSRWCIFGFGMLSGPIAILLNHVGISLGWLYLFMGVLIGGAVFPIAFSISWLQCSAVGAVGGAVGGTVLGVFAWLCAGASHGSVTLDTLGRDDVMLVGNLVSLLSSGVICVVISRLYPAVGCTWDNTTMKIELVEHDPNAYPSPELLSSLSSAMRGIIAWGVSLAILFVLVWPAGMLALGTFSKSVFSLWVGLSLLWGFVASVIIIFLPLWEYRSELLAAGRMLVQVVRRGKNGLASLPPTSSSGAATAADPNSLLHEDAVIDTSLLVPST